MHTVYEYQIMPIDMLMYVLTTGAAGKDAVSRKALVDYRQWTKQGFRWIRTDGPPGQQFAVFERDVLARDDA